jgi:hypothetical protein
MGCFIHHQPLLLSDTAAVEFVTDLYEYTYSINKKVFHSIDEDILPKNSVKALCCNSKNGIHPFSCILDAALFPKRTPARLALKGHPRRPK